MSIRIKIILISIATLFVAIGANTLVNGIIFTRDYSLVRESEATIIAQKLHTQLDRLLHLRIPLANIEGFDDLCDDLVAQHGFITYAMVVDEDGRIVYRNQSNPFDADAIHIIEPHMNASPGARV